jgi:hypothetical protein
LLEKNFDKNDKIQEIPPVSLDKYVQNDKLRVRIETTVIPNINAFQIWTMALPTQNFRLTIVVPEKWRVDCVALVDKKQQNFSLIHEQPHCISINLKSWMLPQNGFAFRISKREDKQIDDKS